MSTLSPHFRRSARLRSRSHARAERITLSLLSTPSGLALVDDDDAIVSQADGPDARLRLLTRARDLGTVCVLMRH